MSARPGPSPQTLPVEGNNGTKGRVSSKEVARQCDVVANPTSSSSSSPKAAVEAASSITCPSPSKPSYPGISYIPSSTDSILMLTCGPALASCASSSEPGSCVAVVSNPSDCSVFGGVDGSAGNAAKVR